MRKTNGIFPGKPHLFYHFTIDIQTCLIGRLINLVYPCKTSGHIAIHTFQRITPISNGFVAYTIRKQIFTKIIKIKMMCPGILPGFKSTIDVVYKIRGGDTLHVFYTACTTHFMNGLIRIEMKNLPDMPGKPTHGSRTVYTIPIFI